MSTKIIVGAIIITAIGIIAIYVKSKRSKSQNKSDAAKTTDKSDTTSL
jgi:FtsZ-interacting cell division protein ZipA